MFYEDSLISFHVYGSLLALVKPCESVSLPLSAENCIRDTRYSTPCFFGSSQS